MTLSLFLLLLQSLDGFLTVIGGDGSLVYISESIHKHLGLFQVIISSSLCLCIHYIDWFGRDWILHSITFFFVFFTQSEHIGLSAYDIIHEDDHANVRTALTDAESKVLDRPGSKRERDTHARMHY